MSDDPSPGNNESPTPSVGSTDSIGASVVSLAPVAGAVEDGVVGDGPVAAVVGSGGTSTAGVGPGAVGVGSVCLATPPDPPDEHAASGEMPTSMIAATRTDPARRTARTVSGTVRSWGAPGPLDDFQSCQDFEKAFRAARSGSILWNTHRF